MGSFSVKYRPISMCIFPFVSHISTESNQIVNASKFTEPIPGYYLAPVWLKKYSFGEERFYD